MRFVTLLLLVLLGWVHAELWFGKAGLPRAMELGAQVREQKARNLEAQARNERLAAEVRDLKEGLEIIEERARHDLGMIKPDELLVQYVRR